MTQKTPSGFVVTEDIRLTSNSRKRQREAHTTMDSVPSTSRDGRVNGASPEKAAVAAEASIPAGEIRPARKFTQYVDYNFSAMTDTKGGFLSTDDDPYNPVLHSEGRPGTRPGEEEKPKHMTAAEWERLQLLRNLRRQKAGPFEPGISVIGGGDGDDTRKKCRECGSLEIDFVWDEVFKCCVCNKCKELCPDKYSLLTKTECREDYLLTDREYPPGSFVSWDSITNFDQTCTAELNDAELLPHLSKPNPHKSHWHDMMLFLRFQVEEYAFKTKWGSAQALDSEFERREADKKKRKEAKFKEKLLDLKRKTRTEAFRRQGGKTAPTGAKRFGDAIGGGKHVHEWGRAVENEDGAMVKRCAGCGMEIEELEF